MKKPVLDSSGSPQCVLGTVTRQSEEQRTARAAGNAMNRFYIFSNTLL